MATLSGSETVRRTLQGALAVLPRLAYLFRKQSLGRFLIIGYSALVLFVWLNFAVHAEYWVPYEIYPVSD